MPSSQTTRKPTAATDAKNIAKKRHESDSLRKTKLVNEAIQSRSNAHRAFAIALAGDAMKDLVKEDDEAFSDLLSLAISDFNVKQIDIANMLDLSTAAVGRWVAGKSAPRPYARGMVLQVLRSLVEKGLIDSGVALIPSKVQARSNTRILDEA